VSSALTLKIYPFVACRSWHRGISKTMAGPSAPMPRLSVVGLGYIGLPTATLFAAKAGFHVMGVDVAEHVVARVNAGEAHFAEPDLDAAVAKAVHSGLLRAALVPEPADAFIIAVPTPLIHDGDGATPAADLRYVEAAALGRHQKSCVERTCCMTYDYCTKRKNYSIIRSVWSV
jgi:threonine dehydrogenase-like Zn-dependent dehydrogenase